MAIISYFLTSHISRPLEQLREGAMAITVGDFRRRVQIEGKDEVAELGKAFNTMTARLEDINRQRSEFVSNASHELKTPLASMKILTESILYQDGLPEEIYKDFLTDINGPVSYTHLDVYKRQANSFLLSTINSPSYYILHFQRILRKHPQCIRRCDNGLFLIPVSYTHLDVYKRQVLCKDH